MAPNRLLLARLTYRRALLAARADPTPARWRQLLRCATNVKAELAARAAWDEAHAPLPPGDRKPRTPPPPHPAIVALRRELALARTLMARQRDLVAESRALCTALAELVERAMRTCRVSAPPTPSPAGCPPRATPA